ncbi:pinin/SDK/memA/ protein conserved region-domain-containing protein [Pyrenochaeta sp. MPI-SDFR-AT-0127]|nr:pinin/SDK/memA/ protein conserved region-domain-containing protein [Pyrenochaeta sp. MPI-SDFR-AT-0127]
MDGPIASAVVLPEELAVPASPSHSLKRRQSSISGDDAKRPRLNDNTDIHKHGGSNNGLKPTVPVRRERGRERRLFGAVLGALSQNPTTAAQKRRTEIEKRQLAQRRLEDEEGEQRKAERRATRKVQRWKEQKHFEMQSMRVRHDNLLNMAHFFRTETEPHLYYKPWETTPDEEERIRNQITEARKVIEREVNEYEASQAQSASRNRYATADGQEASRDAEGTHTGKSGIAGAPQQAATANGGTHGSANSPRDLDMTDDPAEHPTNEAVRDANAPGDVVDDSISNHETTADDPSKDIDDEENGEDIVEEAAEDTVIY